MRVFRILTLSLLILAPVAQAATDTSAASCGTITVSTFQIGETLARFTANVEPEPGDVTFNWAVSTGEIVKGQGTSGIEVSAPKGSFITASVEVAGLAAGCPDIGSASRDIF